MSRTIQALLIAMLLPLLLAPQLTRTQDYPKENETEVRRLRKIEQDKKDKVEESKNNKKDKKDKDSLNELQTLKAENFRLKVQTIKCTATLNDREARLQTLELTAEQSKLEKEFRDEIKPNEKTNFNWSNLKFEPRQDK